MLVAVLNTCSQEELMESSDEESVVIPEPPTPDSAERRRVVRSKILAVGRMARVFSVLRLAAFPFPLFMSPLTCVRSEESERVSELKSMSGSAKLPYGTLAMGAEGIKDAIKGFDDAYALFPSFLHLTWCLTLTLVDVNRTLKTSDCPLTWLMRTRKRAKHTFHRCPRLRLRAPTKVASSRRTVSRRRWRRRFQAHLRARLVPRPRPCPRALCPQLHSGVAMDGRRAWVRR